MDNQFKHAGISHQYSHELEQPQFKQTINGPIAAPNHDWHNNSSAAQSESQNSEDGVPDEDTQPVQLTRPVLNCNAPSQNSRNL